MTRILPAFANYARAQAVPEIDAAHIDREAFRTYTRANRPVVVRGAARTWPACREWSLAGLAERLRDVEDVHAAGGQMVTAPFPEYAGAEVGGDRVRLLRERQKLPGIELIRRLEAGEQVCAYGAVLAAPGMERLRRDIGSIAFLEQPFEMAIRHDGTGLQYDHRIFIYRGGYTDWHFHFADDNLTVQAQGTKEFLLLPADRATFRRMWSVARRRGVWDLPAADHAALASLVPHRAVLEPGDAVFIPVFWWHAVEPATTEVGVTLAFPFKAARYVQFDLRRPGPRWNLRQAWRRRYWRLIPFMLAGAAWSCLARPIGAAGSSERARTTPIPASTS